MSAQQPPVLVGIDGSHDGLIALTWAAQYAVLHRAPLRAVYVVGPDGELVGVVTRKTLVARVVAEGRDPAAIRVGDIAEPPYYTIDADTALDEAFAFIEEHDAERVPVVDGGRLVGVVSRAVLQRRLAEDEEPGEPEPVA